MKFYVASKFENIIPVQHVIKELTELGHENTHDWTTNFVNNPEIDATNDKHGVRDADFVIGIFENEEIKYLGSIAEIGMAIAWGKPILIAGHAIDNMIFLALPQITQFDDVNDLLVNLPLLVTR